MHREHALVTLSSDFQHYLTLSWCYRVSIQRRDIYQPRVASETACHLLPCVLDLQRVFVVHSSKRSRIRTFLRTGNRLILSVSSIDISPRIHI